MFNRIKRYRSLVGIFLVFLAACGSNVVNSDAPLPLGDVPFEVTRDVQENLLKFYTSVAQKPRMRERIRNFNFDYLEISRVVTSAGEASIQGEFLFNNDRFAGKSGTIEIFYLQSGDGWISTGGFHIEEQPVASVTLLAEVRNSLTDEPLKSVSVYASRAGDEKRGSQRILTDESGTALLVVLSGTFQLSAAHTDYTPVEDTRVSVGLSELPVGRIYMTPTNGPPSTHIKFP